MPTPTLYKFVDAELKKQMPSEMVDDAGNLVFFDKNSQIMPKIINYDDDVENLMDELFNGLSLESPEYDYHFKKTFLFKFLNRQINRQTIEAFQFELMATFLTNEAYINRVYRDAEKYILRVSESEGTNTELSNEISKQVSEQLTEQLDKRESTDKTDNTTSDTSRQNTSQKTDGTTTTDNRQAFSDLPQNTVNLNLNSDNMRTANQNEISKNRAVNDQTTDTETETKNSGTSGSESEGTSKGEMSTDSKSKNDSERDAKRDGETRQKSLSYSLDELFKSGGMMEGIFNNFDKKCFLQTW